MLRSAVTRTILAAGVAGTGGICWAVKDVSACEVPEDSLLNYVSQTQKVWYTDCYATHVSGRSRRVSDASAVDALCKAFFRYPRAVQTRSSACRSKSASFCLILNALGGDHHVPLISHDQPVDTSAGAGP